MKITITTYDGIIQIKIQDENFELNIKNLTVEQLHTFSTIQSTDWVMRKTMQAGVSGCSSVFWTWDEEKDQVCILVGEDDELWDFGIVVDCRFFIQEINRFLSDERK